MDNGKYAVLLKDKDQAGVGRGEKVIVDELNGKLKKKRITNYQYCDTMSRLTPLHDGVESWKKHFSTADIVIEAGIDKVPFVMHVHVCMEFKMCYCYFHVMQCSRSWE